MLDGVILLWFVLAALAVAFVAIDIRNTPKSPVLKWGFVLLTAYTGVVGAFLYVLGCSRAAARDARKVHRRALGPDAGIDHALRGGRRRRHPGRRPSCRALFGLTGLIEVALEYVLGFGFGWTIFQALFMRDAAGGAYPVALKRTFMPELLSMNLLMAGMVPIAMTLRRHVDLAGDPRSARFWFVMSMALIAGFIVAYPINWWLVANRLKHGMMTVRPQKEMAGMAMPIGERRTRDGRDGDGRGGQAFAVGGDDDGSVLHRPRGRARSRFRRLGPCGILVEPTALARPPPLVGAGIARRKTGVFRTPYGVGGRTG